MDEETRRQLLAETQEAFERALQKAALSIFDELVHFEELGEQRAMERKILARRWLVSGLRPRNANAPTTRERRKAA